MNKTEKRPFRNGSKKRGRRFPSNGHPRPDATPTRRAHHRPEPRPRIVAETAPEETVELNGIFGSVIHEIQHAVHREGYVTPTPVQAKAIPPQLEGKDLLGSAQTGTGKTAAFVLPLLQKLAGESAPPRAQRPRALILAPTRELAAQIGDSIRTYGRFLRVTHTVIFGGVGQRPQERAMNQGVDIVVATPGRLLDLMQQGFVKLDAIETFILDEADRMLDMGFIPDIKRVLAKLPERRQTAFFSATLAPEIVELAKSMLTHPVRITISPEKPTVEKIEQRVLFVNREDKINLLTSLIREPSVERVIVFTQMKHVANRVCEKLQGAGITAAPIHGNRSQAARTRALEGFKVGKVKVLVATDIAARGIDVDGISHVINFDLPPEAETYVHRIGRTARAGTEGQAVSFCTADERGHLKGIERLIKKAVPEDREHEFHSERAYSAVRSSAPFRKEGARSASRRPHGSSGPRSNRFANARGTAPGSRGPRRRSPARGSR